MSIENPGINEDLYRTLLDLVIFIPSLVDRSRAKGVQFSIPDGLLHKTLPDNLAYRLLSERLVAYGLVLRGVKWEDSTI